MDVLDRATDLLRNTESSLRKLLTEAATSGDYGTVVRLATWARSLSDIVGGADSQSPSVQRPAVRPQGTRTEPRTSKTRIAAHNGAYPRFFRQGDRLVRVGWSKRDKKEYEQRTPLAVVKALSGVMVEKGADGRIFASDELLPLFDSEGIEIPSYQAYAAIALLKHVGLLDQHGRQGYSIPRLSEFKSAAEGVWRNLPEK